MQSSIFCTTSKNLLLREAGFAADADYEVAFGQVIMFWVMGRLLLLNDSDCPEITGKIFRRSNRRKAR